MTSLNKTLSHLLLCLALGGVLMPSCGQMDTMEANSFIWGYYSVGEINATADYIDFPGDGQYCRISINQNPDKMVWLSSVLHNSPGDNGLYDEYCKLHHDTNYPCSVPLHMPDAEGSFCYPASNFTDISVKCLSYWDEKHPEGSSLDDITTYATISIKPFIESGYTRYNCVFDNLPEYCVSYFNEYFYEDGKVRFYPVCKKVNTLSADDLALIGPGSLYEDKEPNICNLFIPKRNSGSPCILRISMTNTNGAVYNSEVTVQ